MESLAISHRLLPSNLPLLWYHHHHLPVSSFPTSTAFTRSPYSSLCFARKHSCPASLSSLKCYALSSQSAIPAEIEKNEEAKFIEASKHGNLVPLYRCIFSDHLTPVLAYRCLVKEDDLEAPSFLFESVEQSSVGNNVGRYSFVGAQPAMEIVAKENFVSVMDHEIGRRTEEVVEDPMQVPRRITEGWTPQFLEELPDVFCGT